MFGVRIVNIPTKWGLFTHGSSARNIQNLTKWMMIGSALIVGKRKPLKEHISTIKATFRQEIEQKPDYLRKRS